MCNDLSFSRIAYVLDAEDKNDDAYMRVYCECTAFVYDFLWFE